MKTLQRECCNYCMWYGPVNANGTMRKHFEASDEPGRRKQVKALGVCKGSGKPYARLSPEPKPEPCGQKLLHLSGKFVHCTKPTGHDKAHAST